MSSEVLTKDDIRILRWACEQQIAQFDANPSGDLFDEEEYQMLRAMKNLPKVKDAPRSPPIPGYMELNRFLHAEQQKRLPITVDYTQGALDLPRPRATAKALMKKLDNGMKRIGAAA